MLLLHKKLSSMLKDIGLEPDVKPNLEDRVVTGPNCVYSYLSRYYEIVDNYIPGDKNKKMLKKEVQHRGLICSPPIVYIIENAKIHGYCDEPDNIITVRYFFGKRGMVYQISDVGIGFDSISVVTAFRNHNAVRGIHFYNNSWGFAALMKPELKARVESSITEPTGTTVTIKYTYK